MKSQTTSPAEFIAPLNMNGLRGRMLRLPARGGKKRDILVIYGHHTSLEDCWALAQELAKYGSVTIPDLPGFGGMQSLYRLGEKPTLNRLADYVASFVKLRYKRRRFVVVGLGFGFVVVTRMLQRYPELAKRVDLAISFGGLTHYDDFNFKRRQRLNYRHMTRLMGYWLPATTLKHTKLPVQLLDKIYQTSVTNDKLRKIGAELPVAAVSAESIRWNDRDLRTHMSTISDLLNVDNCSVAVEVTAWHESLPSQPYLNEHMVEQHLGVVFKDLHLVKQQPRAKKGKSTKSKASAGGSMLPSQLRRALANTKHH